MKEFISCRFNSDSKSSKYSPTKDEINFPPTDCATLNDGVAPSIESS